MPKPVLPLDEAARLAELDGLLAFDAQDPRLLALTRSARRLLDLPIAFIAIGARQRYAIKACLGLEPELLSAADVDWIPAAGLMIEDAGSDAAWRNQPLVTDAPGIRFLSARSLRGPSGQLVGALWTLDRRPRTLGAEEQGILDDLTALALSTLADLCAAGGAGSPFSRAAHINKRKLRESARLLQSVMDSTSSYVHVRDLEGRYLYVNKEYERVFQLSQDQLIGKTIEDAFPPALAHKYRSAEREVIETGKVLRTEAVVQQADGPHTYLVVRSPLFNEAGEIYGACGVGTDITRRINDANELRELNRQLAATTSVQQAILNSANFAIIASGIDGTIRIFSKGAERMLGYAASEMIGRRSPAFLHDPQEMALRAQELSADLEREVTPGFEVFIAKTLDGDADEQEWTYIRKDGERLPVMLSVTALWDEQQHITGFLGIAYDLTERKKVESMKNDFISNVSHELRTPLTSIRGSLGLLAAGTLGPLPPPARAMLDIASNNCERLVRLINDILDIEKIESGHMRFELLRQPLLPLVEHAIASMQAYADQFQVSIVLQAAAPELPVMADADRLIQVIVNLLSNAVKFSERGAEVRVILERRDELARLSVVDQGEGIPHAFRERIFQKFAQADSSDARRKGGTGLGLSISKAIVEKHRGQLDFTSGRPRGTCFYVELPLAEAAAPADRADTAGHVLICEAEAALAESLELLLSQGGLSADIAADAQQARSLLEQGRYDAMTLDLGLGADARDLLDWLRSRSATPGLPVVVVSAQSRDGAPGLDAGGFGIADWIGKPIDAERLLSSLQNITHRPPQGRMRILQIDDDPHTIEIVKSLLQPGHQLDYADSVAAARRRLAGRRYDLVLLDLTLGNGDSSLLLSSLPTANLHTPMVIFSSDESGAAILDKVRAALAKSRSSNTQLLDTLHHLIGRAASAVHQGTHHDSRAQ